MTANLSDLRVMIAKGTCNCDDPDYCNRYGGRYYHVPEPISLAELLAMLEAEGVLRRETDGLNSRGWGATEYFLRTDWMPLPREESSDAAGDTR